jgi:excisionase family DNA binding protein
MSDQPHDSREGGGTTVAEAARLLSITEGAVRKRVERGKLAAERTTDGRLVVYLDATTTNTTRDTTHDRPRQSRGDRYTRSLEDQVEYLRRQLERRDEELREHRRLLAGLIERVPELEAATPQEPSEAPMTVEEEPERVEPRPEASGPQEGTQRRSWWRRVFRG